MNDAVINLITMIDAAESTRRSSRLQQEARRRQPQIDSPSYSDFDVNSYLNDIYVGLYLFRLFFVDYGCFSVLLQSPKDFFLR